MQTSEAGATYGSVIRAITKQKGIGGLWDGFVPWGMVQSISKGAVFGLVSLQKTLAFSMPSLHPSYVFLARAPHIM
jgi:hypothetical protein